MTEEKKETKALVPNDYFAPITEPAKSLTTYVKGAVTPVFYLKNCLKDVGREPESFLSGLYGYEHPGFYRGYGEIVGADCMVVAGALSSLGAAGTAGYLAFGALSGASTLGLVAGTAGAGLAAGALTVVAAPAVILIGAAVVSVPLAVVANTFISFLPKTITGFIKAAKYHKAQKELKKTKVVLATQVAPQLEAPKGFKKITGMFKKKSAPVAAKEIPEPMGTIEHKPIPAVKKPEGSFPL